MRLIFLIKSIIVFSLISTILTTKLPAVLTDRALLSSHKISLNNRYNNTFVNTVFKNNILLTLNYMSGRVHNKSDINWTELNKPSRFTIMLKPGGVFAFHNDILPSYKNKSIKTTNTHFTAQEGFLSDGYLFGDGVCHLASLINWAAADARLGVFAPTNHNFANIPEIPQRYGVSIYSSPGQNLYIENTQEIPVLLIFNYKEGILSLSISG